MKIETKFNLGSFLRSKHNKRIMGPVEGIMINLNIYSDSNSGYHVVYVLTRDNFNTIHENDAEEIMIKVVGE